MNPQEIIMHLRERAKSWGSAIDKAKKSHEPSQAKVYEACRAECVALSNQIAMKAGLPTYPHFEVG